jgi:hypothetical protein
VRASVASAETALARTLENISMRLRLGVPAQLAPSEKQGVLDAALESVTRANEGLIARGFPLFAEAGPGKRFRWRPEPPGDEHFDLASTVLRRGWGDCDDLAPWHAASLRASGEDPEARAVVVPSASGVPGRWHAVVERSGGNIEDPSLAAGMGQRVSGEEGSLPPFWPAMRPDRLTLAAHRLAWPSSGYAARVDVPSMSVPAVYSGLGVGTTPAAALCGVLGSLSDVCGDDADDAHLFQLAGAHDLLLGVRPAEVYEALCGMCGEDEAVGIFPGAVSLAAPFAGKALSALGLGKAGGGAPSGGSPPAGAYAPGGYTPGPIIVRF